MTNGYFDQTVKHVVAESTNLGATNYARHIFNVKASADIDNGKLVNLTDMVWVDNEYFTMVAPTATCRVGLVLSTPIGAETTPYACTAESAFFNKKDEIMRVYDLMEGDKFTVSADGITGSIAVGSYVVADGHNIKVSGTSAPAATVGFVGQIVEEIVRAGGAKFYKIFVRKNG